ncbi:MAG: ATP-dependent helicase, partial [Gammaproteobacteria bacterium]
GLERFRIEVGHKHGVKPGNIVGAIANEAEIESEYIGRIEIFDDYSTVDLPEGMPREVFKHLKAVWVSGHRLQISRDKPSESSVRRRPSTANAGGGKKLGERPSARAGVRRRPAK